MSHLPADLAGAAPRYCYGDKAFTLSFRSDVQKALYILAQDKPSKRDADYLTFAQQAYPGESETAIRARGRAIKAQIKEMAKASAPGTLQV